jgi:arabinan endo-1,5-alpha-L-arabinosidase
MKKTNRQWFKNCTNIFAALALSGLVATGCSDEENSNGGGNGTDDDNPPVGPVFNGPAYPDNYTNISGWDQRAQWNLANVHDPTVVKEGAYFYMYQTDASYGNAHAGHGHFHCRRSLDLVNWEYMGATMPGEATWVKDEINERRALEGRPPIQNITYGYWAPCVRKVGNKYRMYYSIVHDALIEGTNPNTSWGEEAYIGMMETSSLAGNVWEDKGMVICQVADGVVDYHRDGANDWNAYYKFNAIDPSYIETENGEHWLIYGSWHTGIAAVQINPETGKLLNELNTVDSYGIRIAGRGNITANRWQALEGPEIIYNPDTGYYYLFLAYDELSVAYNTRVARSASITGPYVGMNGQDVSQGAEAWPMLTHPYKFNNHTGWVGFAHCAIFQDDANGKWYYSSQARLPENVPGINVSNAVMMGHVRELQWTTDGWPVVSPERYAGVPATQITAETIAGTYEVIIKSYQYRTMQTSITVSLNANGTVGGGITGNWSYDATNKEVLINGNKCKVFDAWDWEATPRKVTLAISGFMADGKPLWGKKLY